MHELILVAEDDLEIAQSIAIYLRKSGYDVLLARDGAEAVKIFEENTVDLVIMDMMMPVMDGGQAIQAIRDHSYVPIIVLSAKTEDHDKILGLAIGADDYMTKPFNPDELLARIRSNLRRYKTYHKDMDPLDEVIRIGGIALDRAKRTLEVDGKPVPLTPLEFKILKLLMEGAGKVFSIEEIYERAWGEPAISTDTVTVHIRRIREKIEIDPKKPRYLLVVWGIGYKFVEDI